MDQATLDQLYRLVVDPPPGSKIAEAKEFGVDLTLRVRNLSLTPTERLDPMKAAADFLAEMRAAMTGGARNNSGARLTYSANLPSLSFISESEMNDASGL